MPKFLILAVDGGGIRGVFAARLIALLQARRPFLSEVKLLAGTSTGAIVAACLSVGMQPEHICTLYHQAGPEIFSRKFFWGPRMLEKALQSPYDILRLKSVLRQVYGQVKMQSVHTPLLIPTTDLKNGLAHVFTSWDCDAKLPLYKAVMASCSAPTYFDPCVVDAHLLADGGLWANNPGIVAVTQAMTQFQASLQDIRVISLGTGHFNECYDENTSSWGLINGWKIRTLTEFVSSMQSETTAQTLQQLLPPGHVLRLNFSQNELIRPDAFARMDYLEHKAEQVFIMNRSRIETFLQELLTPESGQN